MGCFKVLGIVLLMMLPGCCPCVKPRENLPAPISVDEQARRLTEWSRQLPRIHASTVIAGVRLDYRDDKGQDRSVNAEGLLQIRQHWEAAANVPADVLLLGTSFDQPAFEAGRNAQDWWFAIKLDTKKAWLGDATRPVNFATLGGAGSASILRADLVPDLLGLAELPATAPSPRGPILMMLVNDDRGTNDLYYGQMSPDGKPVLAREIIVDRYSGHVAEVRLYDPAGVVAVRSQLSAYAPVTYADGVAKPAVAPEFPRKVVVSYPGQHLTVALEFDEVMVWGEFKPAVFVTPDFAKLGLRVVPVE